MHTWPGFSNRHPPAHLTVLSGHTCGIECALPRSPSKEETRGRMSFMLSSLPTSTQTDLRRWKDRWACTSRSLRACGSLPYRVTYGDSIGGKERSPRSMTFKMPARGKGGSRRHHNIAGRKGGGQEFQKGGGSIANCPCNVRSCLGGTC